ncbi:MAG: hypothetical protein IKO07_13405 [Clostridia bacterium]|nr:hypothetical protein [Clostridia bacterium]
MVQREITLDCGARQLMRARDAVNALSGVIGAEVVTGRSAIRVWRGDELTDEALGAAVRASGAGDFRIR